MTVLPSLNAVYIRIFSSNALWYKHTTKEEARRRRTKKKRVRFFKEPYLDEYGCAHNKTNTNVSAVPLLVGVDTRIIRKDARYWTNAVKQDD